MNSASPPGEPAPHRLPAWRLQLHGNARVLRDGQAPLPLERKQAGLLAWLHRHGPTPRARIAALLWPEAGAAGARANLRQRLARLRAVVGPLVVDAGGALQLAAQVHVEAAAGPRDELLGDADYADCDDFRAWLDRQREADRAAGQRALVGEVRAAAQAGRLDQARRLADELLAFDRESEESYRVLMEVHYMRGDHAAALAAYDGCRDMLRGIYGVLPSAATRQLGETLLQAARQGEAAAATPIVRTAIPVSVLRPPQLVARAAPLAAMLAAWRTGQVVSVQGEGGIGKSRLLTDFAAALGPCATAGARPGDALQPFASLSRLLHAAIDRFAPTLDDGARHWLGRLLPAFAGRWPGRGDTEAAPLRTPHEHAQAIAAVAAVLRACVARGCAAFVLDDLHVADRASVEALATLLDAAFAAEADAETPRFAFGARHDELPAPARDLLDRLSTSRHHVAVLLEPLAQAQAVELLESLAIAGFDASGVATRLVRQIGGNPAYLLESVKLLLSLDSLQREGGELPLPPGIEAVISRRVELLTAPARHIAQLAAIAGASYSVPLAAAALARAPLELSEPLRELEVRQVLYGRQFVHDLVAEAVRRSIPHSIADFMHRFVAEYLEAHHGEPGPIAGHWRACAEWRRAGSHFLAAAALDQRAARPIEQCEMLDAAAGCFERGAAGDELFDALVGRLRVHTAPDRLARRLPLIERLEALAGNEEQRLHALAHRLTWASEQLHDDPGERAADGLARATAIGHRELAFAFAECLCSQSANRGDHRRALEVIESLRPWAESEGATGLRAELHLMLAVTQAQADRLTDALDNSRQAVALLRDDHNELRALAPLSNQGLFHLWRGELAPAHAVLSHAKALRERFHGRGSALLIDMNLGAVLREQGRYGEALAVLEPLAREMREVAALGRDGNTDAVIAENHLAALWLLLGDADRAHAVLASDASGVEARFAGRRAVLALRAARRIGRPEAPIVAELRELGPRQSSPYQRVLIDLELASVAGGADDTGNRLEQLRIEPSVVERPGLHMTVSLRLACHRAEAGRADEALALAEPLAAMLAAITPSDMAMSEFWASLARVYSAAGRPEHAARAGAAALHWVQGTAAGAVPEAMRASFTAWHQRWLA